MAMRFTIPGILQVLTLMARCFIIKKTKKTAGMHPASIFVDTRGPKNDVLAAFVELRTPDYPDVVAALLDGIDLVAVAPQSTRRGSCLRCATR